jgi:hypothetical protein
MKVRRRSQEIAQSWTKPGIQRISQLMRSRHRAERV